MPRRTSNITRFPGSDGIVITDSEHQLLLSVVEPYYSQAVADLLHAAPRVPGGRRMDINHPSIDELLAAISCEAHGHQKLDNEQHDDHHHKRKRKPNSTATRLIAIYDRLEDHLQ